MLCRFETIKRNLNRLLQKSLVAQSQGWRGAYYKRRAKLGFEQTFMLRQREASLVSFIDKQT